MLALPDIERGDDKNGFRQRVLSPALEAYLRDQITVQSSAASWRPVWGGLLRSTMPLCAA
jgi:hypothetical protein